MREVAFHRVDEQRMAQALDDIEGRVFKRWHSLRYAQFRTDGLRDTWVELVEHVAARTRDDPALIDPGARVAMRTAAQCADAIVNLSVFPQGDMFIEFPLIDEKLTNDGEGLILGEPYPTPTARSWVEAFALELLGGEFEQPYLPVILRDDIAPELRSPSPDFGASTPSADPVAFAEMDALCGYIAPGPASALGANTSPLRKPDADERYEATRRLDEAGPLTPDQRLLRVLLDDDRPAFEQALADRLIEHRENVGEDPGPGTLLPVLTIALAALAVRAHGWRLDVHSGYLPQGLVHARRQ